MLTPPISASALVATTPSCLRRTGRLPTSRPVVQSPAPWILAAAMLGASVLVLVATRARHPGWVGLLRRPSGRDGIARLALSSALCRSIGARRRRTVEAWPDGPGRIVPARQVRGQAQSGADGPSTDWFSPVGRECCRLRGVVLLGSCAARNRPLVVLTPLAAREVVSGQHAAFYHDKVPMRRSSRKKYVTPTNISRVQKQPPARPSRRSRPG
jgi:hypothetical protein